MQSTPSNSTFSAAPGPLRPPDLRGAGSTASSQPPTPAGSPGGLTRRQLGGWALLMAASAAAAWACGVLRGTKMLAALPPPPEERRAARARPARRPSAKDAMPSGPAIRTHDQGNHATAAPTPDSLPPLPPGKGLKETRRIRLPVRWPGRALRVRPLCPMWFPAIRT